MLDRNYRGLGHIRVGQSSGLNLFGPQSVTGNIDHIVNSTEDTDIPVFGHNRGITGKIRPILPSLALRVFAVSFKIGLDKTVAVSPDGLEHAGPGVLDADVAGLA